MSALNEEKQAICGLVQIFSSSLQKAIKEYDQRTEKEKKMQLLCTQIQCSC